MPLKIQRAANNVHAVVDADILLHKCSYVGQEYDNASEAIASAAEVIARIKDDLDVDDSHLNLIFSSPVNFRYKLYSEYKANRRNKERPKYLIDVRDFLMSTYPSCMEPYLEADDVIAHYMHRTSDVVCCTIDKDMLQLAGKHYHLNTRKLSQIDQDTADYSLAKQCLMGDSTDNIPGFRGIGPKKAEKILENEDVDWQFWPGGCGPLNAAAQYAWSKDQMQTFIDTYAMVKLQTDIDTAKLLTTSEDGSLITYRVQYDEL